MGRTKFKSSLVIINLGIISIILITLIIYYNIKNIKNEFYFYLYDHQNDLNLKYKTLQKIKQLKNNNIKKILERTSKIDFLSDNKLNLKVEVKGKYYYIKVFNVENMNLVNYLIEYINENNIINIINKIIDGLFSKNTYNRYLCSKIILIYKIKEYKLNIIMNKLIDDKNIDIKNISLCYLVINNCDINNSENNNDKIITKIIEIIKYELIEYKEEFFDNFPKWFSKQILQSNNKEINIDIISNYLLDGTIEEYKKILILETLLLLGGNAKIAMPKIKEVLKNSYHKDQLMFNSALKSLIRIENKNEMEILENLNHFEK